jgi:hypothetical protein
LKIWTTRGIGEMSFDGVTGATAGASISSPLARYIPGLRVPGGL